MVLYMRGHEGRGIGLVHKLQAYQLQDNGRDTVDANLELGLPTDARDGAVGAQILADLGVKSMRLMTNSPDKRSEIEGNGLGVIDRVALPTQVTERRGSPFPTPKTARPSRPKAGTVCTGRRLG